MEFSPSSVGKGVLLVASPTLNDPNFRQTVVLVVEHGPEGTLGLILNRSTNVLLSEALPDVTALKGTSYRLFAGGPVEATRLLLLFRVEEPPAEARSVFDGVYVGGTPALLERIMTQGGLRGNWDMKCAREPGRPCRQVRSTSLTTTRPHSGRTVLAASRSLV